MKSKKIKIGQEVWIIGIDLSISKKQIIAIVNEEKETKYKLDFNSCGGITEKEFYLTKHKAEVVKKNFIDDLHFRVGDLIIFKIKEYSNTEILIGTVNKIKYKGSPYEVTTSYKNIYYIVDEDIVLKVKNNYIENYGNIKELYEEYNRLGEDMQKVKKKIYEEFDLLEKDLKQSFKKQFGWRWVKKKPLFKNKFNYNEKDCN